MNLPLHKRLRTGGLLLLLLIGSFAFGQTTVTYSFSAAGAVSGENEDAPGISVDSNIGFGSFKNDGTSDPGIFSDQLRLYQNATKGGSIKIYASNGVTITKVVVNASGRTGQAGYTIDGGSGTNLSISGGAYTMSDISAASVVEFYQRESGQSNRIYVDSFEVTYSASGGNAGPSITNIVQAPESPVDPAVTVLVSADINDPDGVASAQLKWGTASGVYDNTINMSDLGGGEYYIPNDIPAQADGTTVYYVIEATDNHATSPETSTSVEQSYYVENPKPVISNIQLVPDANSITSNDGVLASADITDTDGIASAELRWGTTSGTYSNTIAMTHDTGDSYSTSAFIPAQANGTTVYYVIEATDTRSGTTTTLEGSYTVNDPAPVISEIVQIPSGGSVTTSDTVLVTADVTTAGNPNSLDTVELLWGTVSGTYSNTINMSLDTGNTYMVDNEIPAQLDGVTVYYVIQAKNNFPATTTSAEQSYTVINPAPLISNIQQVPDSSSVTSADDVIVSADITDNDPITVAELNWGTASGNLPNTITMSLDTGDSYSTDAAIPAHADGTTIYYEIKVTDDNAIPKTSTSPEQNYTVADPLVFEIPYDNPLNDSNTRTDAEQVGFTFTNVDVETGAGGYMRMYLNSTVVSPAIDFSQYDDLTVAFELATWGGEVGQKLTVSVSDDDGATYSLAETHNATRGFDLTETVIDLSGLNGTSGRIKFEMTDGQQSLRFRNLYIYDGYIYYNNEWRPTVPGEEFNDPTANFYIRNGTTTLNNANINNLKVYSNATLEIKRVLNIAGNVVNDGEIVFLSTENRTGELGPVDESSSFAGSGIVTMHRYMSGNRSYRMVSSSVTTTTSIHDNWQEGATSNTDNPAPGYGTHITGTQVDQTDGFDATATGNPSMFHVPDGSQSFAAIDNTDINTLEAGKPYLLFVRGDRSIDLNENTSNPQVPTILRASGELAHGISIQSFNTDAEGEYVMFGNPYQSAVDMSDVFASSINVNPNYFFIYDPSLGNHGSYVTVNLDQNGVGTNTSGSEANQYLQVGQGAQAVTAATGNSSVVFHQADKAPGNFSRTSATGGNPLLSDNMLTVQLYTTERFNNGESVHDSFGIIFDDSFSNELTLTDALKPMNFYENLGIDHDGTYLSLERRAMPEPAEVYALYSSGYAHSDYTLKLTVDGLDETLLYLDDHYNETSTLLETGDNVYHFSVDANDDLSLATDRFSIRTEERLGVEDTNMLSGIRLYPNPLEDNTFYVNAPKLDGETVTLTINDMLGREVYNEQQTVSGNRIKVDLSQNLNSGIYMVKVSSNGADRTLRIIKR